jgi:two-component system response regulator PhcR
MRSPRAAAAEPELAILFVDDDPVSRRVFSGVFGREFNVVTAASAGEALEKLAQPEHEYAVVVTDFRMPGRDGMKLLRTLQREHRHLVRLLATAYAEKDVAIAAVNDGKVLRILEKPLAADSTREALEEALALYRAQSAERATNERAAASLRETLGFLAHELNTPLATVRGLVASVAARYVPPQPGQPPGPAQFNEDETGELLAALERAERRALYCQSLVSTFVQSARDAYPGALPQSVSIAGLVEALLDEFPFEEDEREWVAQRVTGDFRVPGRRDLLYLVLCTLTKNALIALRGRAAPHLTIEVGVPEGGRPSVRFADNGPGIPQDILGRLTREPVTTRAGQGGNGMGLMFCRRVMESIGGGIEISSELGVGTTVTLFFKPQ